MAKTKTPFLSLSSHGSIGNAITAQKRGNSTLIREKPIPTYRRTLAQNYQRWDYQDQAYLWTLLSEAEKAPYRALGSRSHMTGFAYWMSIRLKTLPDLAARWPLDTVAYATVYDTSKNANHGTVYGASPATGQIDKCLSFDGIDDYVDCGDNPSLSIVKGTWSCFVKIARTPTEVGHTFYIIKGRGAKYSMYLQASGNLQGWIYVGGVPYSLPAPHPIVPLNTWTHIALTYDGETLKRFMGGIQWGENTDPSGDIDTAAGNLNLGRWAPATFVLEGDLDHPLIHNRPLDTTELTKHSERRYPV